VALPLAWSALLAFSSYSGLPLAQAFTRIMKRLHLCVIHHYSFLLYHFLTTDTTRVSFGAGSALGSRENALVANTSGCGSRYLLRQYFTSHYISGQRVSGRSMKSTSFIGGTLRGSDMHRGGRHWECFCKPSPASALESRIPLTNIDYQVILWHTPSSSFLSQ
jgi:hypothetical protein